MNDDKVKGTIDDAAGRVKRQVGEWTGDSHAQAEGAAQQIKGKAEKVVGNVRDAIHNTGTHTDRDVETNRGIDDNTDRETVRERK